MVDKLKQRIIGRHEALNKALNTLHKRHHWPLMSWSGRGLDYNPNYLELRSAREKAAGFTMLNRAGTSCREAVDEIIEGYGVRKASRVEGELPGWLDVLLTALEKLLPPASEPVQHFDRLL
jgi:hypothetical protein